MTKIEAIAALLPWTRSWGSDDLLTFYPKFVISLLDRVYQYGDDKLTIEDEEMVRKITITPKT